MSSIAGWQDDRDNGNGSSHEAASMAHEHLLLLTDRVHVEIEEQRRITSEMMDEKLRAVMEEIHERLRRTRDDMQAQMETRLDGQREATQTLLGKSGENTRLIVQSHCKGIEDRLEAQHRGFEERLAALTIAPPQRLPPLPEQEQPELPAPEAMTEEVADRLEAFRLLEWRVGEIIKRERAAFRDATSSMVLALEQDRADRKEMENRLEQTAEACRKAAHDTRAALDLGLADHASMVRALREELGRRDVTAALPSEGQEMPSLPTTPTRLGRSRRHQASGGFAHEAVEERPRALEKAVARDEGDVDEQCTGNYLVPIEQADQDKGGAPEDVELTSQNLDQNDKHPLQESVWDGCLFLYTEPIGRTCSTLSMFAFLLNTTMQFCFCLIVNAFMLEQNVTNETLTQLLKFRAGVAHDISQSDKFTRQSMASQICLDGGNQKLHTGAGQMGLQTGVEQFLRGGGGIYLTLLVQACWLGSILQELSDQYYFATAVLFRLPTGPRTILIGNGSEELSTYIKCVSRTRKAFFLFAVALPRFIIAIALGVSGVRFLSTTESMDELVLNAVALGFVLDLDELIFSVMAPRRLHVLITTMKPLELVPMMPGLHSFLVIVGLSAMLFLIYVTLTAPFYWRLNMAYTILCGGTTEFVFAENAATGMLHVARSSDSASTWSVRELTVLQVAGPKIEDKYGWGIEPEVVQACQSDLSEDAFAVPTTGWEATELPFDSIAEDTQEAYEVLLSMMVYESQDISYYMSCQDLDVSASVQNYLSQMLGIPDFRCQYVGQDGQISNSTLCSQHNMTFLRALCPQSCGCSHDSIIAQRTGFFDTIFYGCPNACKELWQLHKNMNAPWAINKYVSMDALDVMPNLTSRSNYAESYDDDEYVKFYDWIARYFGSIGNVMVARPFESQRVRQQIVYLQGICFAQVISRRMAQVPTAAIEHDDGRQMTASCGDTSEGAVDAANYSCDDWVPYSEYCSYSHAYDDTDFTNVDMCCACGGGSTASSSVTTTTTATATASCEDTSEGAVDAANYSCDDWVAYSDYCSYSHLYYDDTDFTNVHMCCACGGGSTGDNVGCVHGDDFIDYVMAGGMTTSLLDGQWKLHPDVPHPRDLTGCNFLTSWEVKGVLGLDLCSVGYHTSIRSLCPNECNCAEGMEECPTVAE